MMNEYWDFVNKIEPFEFRKIYLNSVFPNFKSNYVELFDLNMMNKITESAQITLKNMLDRMN